MITVRIDVWLWAARFFKTRALAKRSCELGRTRVNGQPAKPAREVHVGDLVEVETEGGDFQLQVLMLSDIRGSAPVAQALYQETEASRATRQKMAAERKAMRNFVVAPEGKPSKRDRRKIIQFRRDSSTDESF